MVTHDGFNVVAPKHLIVPVVSGAPVLQPTGKGTLFISGVKLYFNDGTGAKLITSA